MKLTPVRFGEGAVAELETKPASAPRKGDYSSWSRSSGSSVEEGVSSFGELVFTARVAVEFAVAK